MMGGDDHRGHRRLARARVRAAPVVPRRAVRRRRDAARRSPRRSWRRSSAWAPRASATPGRRRDAIFLQQGITFETVGEDGPSRERPFPLDLVPRILSGAGVAVDQAGPRAADPRAEPLRRRRLPRARDRPRGHRPVEPRRRPLALRARRPRHPPAGRRLLPRRRLRPGARQRRHLEGARGQRPHAVGHLLRAREPRRDDAAGAGPVRRATACGRSTSTRSCCSPRCARSRRRADSEATVVVWTPGPLNSAYFEHAFLARQMGVELVEASRPRRARRRPLHAHDRGPRARPRGLPPPRRRLHRPARVPPGLDARRARASCAPTAPGTVAIANAIGTGVADDKADLPLRAGDDPLLPRRGAAAARTCATYLLTDPEQLEYVLDHLDELVVKPTGESGGKGVLDRPARRPTRSSRALRRRSCARTRSAGSPRRS